MTGPHTRMIPQIDPARLPPGESDSVVRLVRFVMDTLSRLNHTERMIFTTLWMYIAQASAPVGAGNLRYRLDIAKDALDALVENRLVWFDNDLRAVLQCPPFSALHTAHEVKAFGWERAYVCSMLDVPLALLVYGPNTWLKAESTCPRSGEILRYRVMLDNQQQIHMDVPPEAANWCVWIPSPADGYLSIEPNGVRATVNLFYTQADYDTYRQYHPAQLPGAVYTLEQAVYVSQCLLHAYQHALESEP